MEDETRKPGEQLAPDGAGEQRADWEAPRLLKLPLAETQLPPKGGVGTDGPANYS